MTYRDAQDRLGHELAMHLRAAYARLRRRSNLVFANLGMTSDQYVVLTVLEAKGHATQQELVRLCYSDTGTMGAMLSLLETKQLIERAPHPQDRRARSASLTSRGLDLMREMQGSSYGLRAELVQLFDEAELAMLLGFLDRLAGAIRLPKRKPRPRTPRQAPARQGAE